MKPKTMYRMTITEHANISCNDIVIMAAKSNGGKNIPLAMLKNYYDCEAIRYPNIHANSIAELIGDKLLHIDRKVGDNYETVCVIEQVEIFDLATENVVIQRYDIDKILN